MQALAFMSVPPSISSLLEVLPKPRLVEVGRHFRVGLESAGTREAQVVALGQSGQVTLQELVEWMAREELRRACEKHGLAGTERGRPALAKKLLDAAGAPDSARPLGLFGARRVDRLAPEPGDIVRVRHRQYLVEEVAAPPEADHATLVDLVCLDDDNQGSPLQVLWELELGARVVQPEAEGLGNIVKLDPPRHFAAYLHALRWNSVTATDARLFQSPFRAGIKLLNHQLVPLRKALELPRANLFIADDVGLGKTIEAGLILQELELRQRVDFVVIVCPASISLQWRREMEKRFGQRFEIYDREFVARRRSERGFGVQAWSTHNRFIISYQTLRRPEYFESLIQHLGARQKKSLLVLDEAHTAAPATSSKYAVDSRTTETIRDLAPRFENRLFLSATPHNGHSNSFSALMEILDPQRFTRGVPINGSSSALTQVMVRRLKRDLSQANLGTFPLRHVVAVSLEHQGHAQTGTWRASYSASTSRTSSGALQQVVQLADVTLGSISLGDGGENELRLAELLAEYTRLMKPKKGLGQLVFINLQKRLLSSTDAFFRTLEAHAERMELGDLDNHVDLDLPELSAPSEPEPDSTYDSDEDLLDRDTDASARSATRVLQSPSAHARELLSEMLGLAHQLRSQPDAKALALIDWIRRHQCSGVTSAGAQGKGQALQWQAPRLLIFTEYADTKRYLTRILETAIEGTSQADERIMGFHGAMSDEQREAVQRAFNGDLTDYPVRILIATDAAREGLNLQNHCADLFHYDIPWNPARMEQRNGRIDRTLQPSPEVRCHYFVYPARPEDAVLKKLAEKVETIQAELGSLGEVVMQRLEHTLAKGINAETLTAMDNVQLADFASRSVAEELEAQRQNSKALQAEDEEVARIWNQSQKLIDFQPERLRDAVDVGLELAGAARLTPIDVADIQNQQVFELPELDASWTETLNSLRPPRERDEAPWDWQKRPPQPVVFRALDRIGEERVHLHLEHPFVQRILSRFRSQGYSARDLSRVTVVPNPADALVRVIAFGRVSLFGPGAARLHDELVSVAAQWLDSGAKGHLRPFADEADRRAVETLEALLQAAETMDPVSPQIQSRLLVSAAEDFAALWQTVKADAEERAHRATQKLAERGHSEAEALRTILKTQRQAIRATLEGQQLSLGEQLAPEEKKQWENDKDHMAKRLGAIEQELETEPADIEALYKVSLKRLEPVGLVYLWPTSRM